MIIRIQDIVDSLEYWATISRECKPALDEATHALKQLPNYEQATILCKQCAARMNGPMKHPSQASSASDWSPERKTAEITVQVPIKEQVRFMCELLDHGYITAVELDRLSIALERAITRTLTRAPKALKQPDPLDEAEARKQWPERYNRGVPMP